MSDGRYLADGDEPLFVDRFADENGFSAALYEGGVAGVLQDNNEQEDYNDDDNSNMN